MVVTSWSWSSDLFTESSGIGQLQLCLSYPGTGSCRCSCMWVSTLTNGDSLYSVLPTLTPAPPLFEALVCPVTSLWIFGFFYFCFFFSPVCLAVYLLGQITTCMPFTCQRETRSPLNNSYHSKIKLLGNKCTRNKFPGNMAKKKKMWVIWGVMHN